ncbi:Dihydrolipoyllysine-residue succinyltransferase component of 2-oxoglutarate dehydrogenase complex [Rickettsiales endosymbiont of Paramecium tredecaurelia]|uniref:2-oxoglutarate dehydrogenase complex dihydrolipoyllysine-residue succinyltransferase n=1 Tax=Candidatus Sarmatiella mevalonica TaxID=2770581 RepID=UPI001922752A|nr:2-oxoglutarate dehydrogenase complex dihydrolipoyllysine-residue succinyltransferase [Candidatus Sarmatiella mevalonica]MBL3284546.1 Dihydrolipoyllysine-residue succinyltransferase component of 2-oxoglutarate dehydrogenase complex [Candidatus Sarmatiella mevalonica]
MQEKVLVPALGESILTAKVAKWLKTDGQLVQKDEIILELETEKITLELVAPCQGILSVVAKEGSEVKVQQLLAYVALKNDSEQLSCVNDERAEDIRPIESDQSVRSAQSVLCSLGREVGGKAGQDYDLSDFITAVPPAARYYEIDNNDSKTHTSTHASSSAAVHANNTAADVSETKAVKMSVIRQTIAKRMKEAQNTAAILTTFNKIDMSSVLELRERYGKLFQDKHGIKLGFMSFFVQATVAALKAVPIMNAKIVEDQIVYQYFYNIGVAIGLDGALVVPTIYKADSLSFSHIEQHIASLAEKARSRQLAPQDLMNATFSITNGGIYGSLFSTPIINPPQSAILGMHKIEKAAVVIGDKIEIRPMMYVALSYDHRIIDGKDAVTFLVKIKNAIEHPENILLDLL